MVAHEGCPHHVIPFTRQITLWQDLKCLLSLIRYFRQERPDIVHTHTPKAGLLGMLAAWITRVPVRIHTVAGMPLMVKKGMIRQLLLAMERLTYGAAHQVWPNSKSLYDFILKQGLARASKLQVILKGSSNGIDLSAFQLAALDASRLADLRLQYGLGADDFIFLSVARMVTDKGIPELVRAFQLVNIPHAKLLLLGSLEQSLDPLPEETLQALSGVDPRIIHVHWSDEVAYFMAMADVLVHPSHREGFPNVLLQAGAMACPVICSDIPGNIDIISHEETGLIFPVKQQVALEQTLEEVHRHYDAAQIRAKRLQEQVFQYYARERFHAEILRQYQVLLTK